MIGVVIADGPSFERISLNLSMSGPGDVSSGELVTRVVIRSALLIILLKVSIIFASTCKLYKLMFQFSVHW